MHGSQKRCPRYFLCSFDLFLLISPPSIKSTSGLSGAHNIIKLTSSHKHQLKQCFYVRPSKKSWSQNSLLSLLQLNLPFFFFGRVVFALKCSLKFTFFLFCVLGGFFFGVYVSRIAEQGLKSRSLLIVCK